MSPTLWTSIWLTHNARSLFSPFCLSELFRVPILYNKAWWEGYHCVHVKVIPVLTRRYPWYKRIQWRIETHSPLLHFLPFLRYNEQAHTGPILKIFWKITLEEQRITRQESFSRFSVDGKVHGWCDISLDHCVHEIWYTTLHSLRLSGFTCHVTLRSKIDEQFDVLGQHFAFASSHISKSKLNWKLREICKWVRYH